MSDALGLDTNSLIKPVNVKYFMDVSEPVKHALRTVSLDGLKVQVYVEKFENAYLILISKNGIRLGTLVCSLKLKGGLTKSMTLLGWRGEVQARMLAEKVAYDTGLITLLSTNVEEHVLQRNIHTVFKTIVQCMKDVK